AGGRRWGGPLEPRRAGGACVAAEERVLPATAVVGEQRVVAAEHGQRQSAAAREAVAWRLDEIAELVGETGEDPTAERERERGIHEGRLGDEPFDAADGIAGAVGHAQLRHRRATQEDERVRLVGNLEEE